MKKDAEEQRWNCGEESKSQQKQHRRDNDRNLSIPENQPMFIRQDTCSLLMSHFGTEEDVGREERETRTYVKRICAGSKVRQ